MKNVAANCETNLAIGSELINTDAAGFLVVFINLGHVLGVFWRVLLIRLYDVCVPPEGSLELENLLDVQLHFGFFSGRFDF